MNMLRMMLLPVAVSFLLSGPSAYSQEKSGDKDAGKTSNFNAEFLGQLQFIKGRLMDLHQAMSQEKATWRPAEGVRSVSEVYLHAALANYFLINYLGLEVPEDIKPQMDPAKWDKKTTNKPEIKQIMERSFSDLTSAAKKLTDADLERTVNVFGMDMSVRNFMVSSLNHLHEHLGQAIAYARSTGVTPPWSAKAQEQTN